jgi:Holliday junction resolvase-like predicted endonuclease
MAREKYRDQEKVTVFVEVPKEVKEDFLDACYAMDKKQAEGFAQLVRFYKEEMGVKPRPSRPRK